VSRAWGFTIDVGLSVSLHDAHAQAPAKTPDGYRLRTWTRAGVTRALVRTTSGAFAARGQIAVTGSTTVVDQVETDSARQRRGLGRLVMRVLTEAASEQGATAGVLGATREGRALYETMGWRVLAPLTGAMRGPDAADTLSEQPLAGAGYEDRRPWRSANSARLAATEIHFRRTSKSGNGPAESSWCGCGARLASPRKRGTPADARLGFLETVSIGQQVESPTP
jgi:GNAT superfamily N-acetyltransferase